MKTKLSNEQVRMIRVANRLTQRQFAQLLGYSFGYIGQVETYHVEVTQALSDRVISVMRLTRDDIAALDTLKELIARQ